jgi:hypothetical protein
MHDLFVAPCRALADVVIVGEGDIGPAIELAAGRIRTLLAAPSAARA